jgi:DNA ligase-1
MAFDILYYNDKSLLKETFESRRKTLHENFSEIQGQFMFAKG